MNEYRWDDISLGLTAAFEAAFTPAMLEAFATLSGDLNPLHTDPAYAAINDFPAPVVFGLMTSSLYSRLVGMYLPGKFALLQGIDLDFIAPAFAGDTLSVKGEVVFLNAAYHRFEIKARMLNQHGKLVSKAMIRVGFHAA